jgi:hypothetical protein
MEGRIHRCLDWNETIPHYGTPLIMVERFKTSLHVGSTVSIMDPTTDFCSITDHRTNMFYGRIVNIVPDDDNLSVNNKMIALNVFLPFELSVVNKSTQPIMYGSMNNIPELVMSNIIIHVPLKQIYDICFVFSVTNISTGNAFCEGIINAFIIRFRCAFELLDNNINQPEYINLFNYYCFASLCPLYRNFGVCYHSRIWSMISMIQYKIVLVLNLRQQNQQTFCSRRAYLNIDMEQWNYIIDRCNNNTTIKQKNVKCKQKMVVHDDLYREQFRDNGQRVHITFDNLNYISCFNALFGDTVTIGCRNKKPAVGTRIPTNVQSPLNVIRQIEFKSTINSFHHVFLNIYILYTKFIHIPPNVRIDYIKAAVNNEKVYHHGDINDANDMTTMNANNISSNVLIGAQYSENHEVYVITGIVSNNIIIQRMYPRNLPFKEIIETDFESVSQKISNYLSLG